MPRGIEDTLDRIRREVLCLAAEDGWAERIGSGPFRYADGGHNPFLAKHLELNGPEALADLAARTSRSNPDLRRRWLRAVRPPRRRDARGRFV